MTYNLIPFFIQQQFKKGEFAGQFSATTLFLDIAGFTPLTERLMAEGKEGAEILSGLVNGIFEPVIDLVYNLGGWITSFAGDAFTAVFPEDRDGRQAAEASLEIIALFKQQGLARTRLGAYELTAKIGLSSGLVTWGIAGNAGHWTYYFLGPAIEGCSRAEHECSAMEIIADQLFQSAHDPSLFSFETRTGGFARLCDLRSASAVKIKSINRQDLEAEIVRRFIPVTILDNPQPGEFRNVASVFVGFRNADEADAIKTLAMKIMERADAAACYFEGLDFGDKGCTALFLFGVPVVFERELERAADFALNLRREFGDRMRAGITFGMVFAGIKGGSHRSSYGVLGDTVNVSARLMMKATWGEILMPASVAERLQNTCDQEKIGVQVLKGKSKPLAVARLIKTKPAGREKLYTGVMIGRERELAVLQEQAAGLTAGRFCGVVYIYGDAGMGKSRLAYEFCESVRPGVQTRYLPCDNILRKSLNPFTTFLGEFFETAAVQAEDERKTRFEEIYTGLISQVRRRAGTEAIVNELIRTKSIIAGLIGIRWPGSLYEELEPRERFENTLYALRNFFQALSLDRPIIIVLDDMHWLDADSRQAFAVLTRRLENFPIMVIAAGRFHDDGSRPILELEPSVLIREIVLNCFDPATTELYVNRQLGGPPAADLKAFITDKSQGNPFFIEQLCLYLRENGLIRSEGKRLALIRSGPALPAGIHAVITARIDRLGRELREMVQVAAVLGNEFESRVLRTMISLYRSALGTAQFESLLAQGENEMIWSAISELKYLFKNVLVQEVAYEMQLRQQLRILHGLAGAAIEKNYPADKTYYEDLAYHYGQAEDRQKMLVYLEKAGDYAREKYENDKALNFYDKLTAALDDPQRRIDIQNRKAGVLHLIGRWPEAEKILLENIEASAGQPLLEARNRADLAELLINKSEYDRARELAAAAQRIYEQHGDRHGICTIQRLQGVICQSQGDIEGAMSYYRRARQIAEELNDRSELSYIISNIGAVYWSTGDYERARDHFLEYLKIAEELNDKKSMGMAMLNLGVAYRNLGDDQKAEEYYRQKLEISRELGDKRGLGIVIGNMGALHLSRGEYEEARRCYLQRIEIAEELGDRRGVGTALGNLASIYKAWRQYDQALTASDQAIKIMRALGVKYYLCSFLDTQAELFLLMDRFDEARQSNQEAGVIAEEIKYHEVSFNVRLRQARITARHDPATAIRELTALRAHYPDEENQAVVNYFLYQITGQPDFRQQAIDGYQRVLSRQFEIEYQQRLDELRADAKSRPA